jgi:hypothetical protein
MFSAGTYWIFLLAACAAWVFGAIYYTLLGKIWLGAQGLTQEKLMAERSKRSTLINAYPFVLSFVAEVVIAWVLCGMMLHMGMTGARAGMISGAFVWFGFVLTTIAVNNAYTFRSWKITAIDALHWLVVFIIIGAVVGGFSR